MSAADPTPGVAPPRLWRRRKLVAWRRLFMAESKANRMALHVYGRVERRSHGAVVMRPRLWPHRHFYGGEPRRRPAGLILGTKSASALASLWPRRKTYGHELRRLHGVVAGAPRLWRRRKTHRPAADPMATSKDRHMVPRRLRPRRRHRVLGQLLICILKRCVRCSMGYT